MTISIAETTQNMTAIISNVIFATVFISECLFSQSAEISARIYGGDTVSTGDIPYIVSIENERDQQLCAGSILNNRMILTVAHCVANETSLKIYAGLVNVRRKNAPHVQLSNVKEVIVHPEYDYSLHTIDNDLALLLLEANLTFTDAVQPIDIIDEVDLEDAIADGEAGRISGWGSSEEADRTRNLKSAEITLLDNKECLADIKPDCHEFNSKTHICTGPLTGPRRGVGQYDDGGPLEVNGQLAGVILHGRDHEDEDDNCHLSSIYIKIPNFRGFLDSYILSEKPKPQTGLDESCLIELEFTLQFLNETFNIFDSPEYLSRAFLFTYKFWYFGNTQQSKASSSFYQDLEDDYEKNEMEDGSIENLPGIPQKLIINMKLYSSPPNTTGGSVFLLPILPLNFYIIMSTKSV